MSILWKNRQIVEMIENGTITGLCDDSRRVKSGNLFFAFSVPERERFIQDALQAGATLVIGEGAVPESLKANEKQWVSVSSVAEARLSIAEKFYEKPFEKLCVHAVTGTNGKTTSAFLMREMLRAAGKKTALLGTICNCIETVKMAASLTTPGCLDLFDFAHRAVLAGVTDLVMEASSHALLQGRVAGISFATALFSNLTQDHLDYHHTMENYFDAKKLLFKKYLAANGTAVINVDDAYGSRLAEECESLGISCVTVSRLGKKANVSPAKAPVVTENKTEFLLPMISETPFISSLCGEFNVDNALLVLAWANSIGIPESAMRNALKNVKVPGRFEKVYAAMNRHIIVDYAHTPDALERILKTARSLCVGKLHVVFGCGGDRDKTKRPIMGNIAQTLADAVYVTSDNPRMENPTEIIKEITNGMQGFYRVIENRAQAIAEAVSELQSDDWLVVAGKGHETYQIIGKEKTFFDDAEEILKAVQSVKGKWN